MFFLIFLCLATHAPSTASPTNKPTTTSPTLKPTTRTPTLKPTTSSPTLKPTTRTPTTRTPTLKPTTGSPTTANPTTNFPTKKPTRQPTTRTPTRAPVPMDFFESLDGSINDQTGQYLMPINSGKCDMSNSSRNNGRQGGSRGIPTEDRTNYDCVSSCEKNEKCVAAQFIQNNQINKCILVTACDVVQSNQESLLTYKTVFLNQTEVSVFPEMKPEGIPYLTGREMNRTAWECVDKCIKDVTCKGVLYNPIYFGPDLTPTCLLYSNIYKIGKNGQTYNLTESFDNTVTSIYNFMVTYLIIGERTQSPIASPTVTPPGPGPVPKDTAVIVGLSSGAVIIVFFSILVYMKKKKKRINAYALLEKK